MTGAPSGGTAGNMQKMRRDGVNQQGRENFGVIWIKVGDSIKPHRVHTGISDGLNTEIHGKIEEGAEVVVSMITAKTTQAGSQQQQQQNPFVPQPPRGGAPRGGR